MNLCRPRAARKRGQVGWRRRQIACATEKRTGCCGRRHRVFQNNTDPKRPGGEQGGAAPQEEHYGMVAEERPQGTASVPQDSSRGGVDRAVQGFLYGTRYCRRRDSRSRPGSTGNYEQSEGGESDMTTPSRHLAVQLSGSRSQGAVDSF